MHYTHLPVDTQNILSVLYNNIEIFCILGEYGIPKPWYFPFLATYWVTFENYWEGDGKKYPVLIFLNENM